MFASFFNYCRLKKISKTKGAALFGVADISDPSIKAAFNLSDETRKKVNRAVCLGVGLSALVLSDIQKEPTKLYYHHYRMANMFLDQLAFCVSGWIQGQGFLSMPIAASQIVDWQKQNAHVSHKNLGVLAGLGWIGRNNLLVTRDFGSQFRIVTILTDMPLKVNKPVSDGCGSCFACLKACPTGAIRKDQRDFRHLVCYEQLKDYQRRNVVGQYICGICVKACSAKITKNINKS
ncbi:MAG: hypothetical protein ABIC68_07975 [Candidatus Omnitrophota bacterium]